jgi:transcriptional regulator with XRE-family HTH domain
MRVRRQARGWSIRYGADRAGVAHTTWSRIEKGQVGADNRFVVADIARALGCSVADLTGAPGAPADRTTAELQAAAYTVRHALAETDVAEPPLTQARPMPELRREFDLICHLRRRCDDLGTARRLPDLLRELHAATHGKDRADALRMLTQASAMSSGVARYAAGPSDMWMAAERCRQLAAALGDPVVVGLAEYERALAAISLGTYARALGVATRAADDLRPQVDAAGGHEVMGMLLMTCAFAALGERQRDESLAFLAEAEQLAARTGDTDTFGLMFGPTNINIWRVAMEVDGGEPGRAVEIARETTPTRIDSQARAVTFYADAARALSRLRGKDRDALRMLLTAERVSPHRVRGNALARETTRTLLERSNRAAGRAELVGLCERMALPT